MAFSAEQLTIIAVLSGVLVLLVFGRWRYDMVAFSALVVAVIIGVVPAEQAFVGFGHPATIIIALVLVVSYGLAASGAISFIARHITAAAKNISTHIALMSTVGGALSAVMNNVGALALLMPVDITAARKHKRSPSATLMPLSFATILGGLVTLIGTPPNIIIASYRANVPDPEAPGQNLEAFKMFDFAPVGAVCAVIGIAFIALIGWRLIPRTSKTNEDMDEPFSLDDYIAELSVGEESAFVGISLLDLENACKEADVSLLNVIRGKNRLPRNAGWIKIQDGDILIVETAAESIDKFVSDKKLKYVLQQEHEQKLEGADLELVEYVVRPGAAIEGHTSAALSLVDHYATWLVGIQRQGRRIQTRVRRTNIQAGDVLLLIGPGEQFKAFADEAGLLPLAKRGLELASDGKAVLAAGIFAAAIGFSSFGYMSLPIALGLVCVLYLLLDIVPLKQLYDSIEWPVVVLIGSLIPIGMALETSGTTVILANGIVDTSAGLPPWVILTIIMVLTMTLSDVLNNTATALVAAPIAVEVATNMNVNPDPFLMGVAVAASCAFLTPIGHKNNTLIMGPGGYRFGDYWRLGLPLEIIIIAVAVPMILLVWPL